MLPCAVPATGTAPATPKETARPAPKGTDTTTGALARAANHSGLASDRSVQPSAGTDPGADGEATDAQADADGPGPAVGPAGTRAVLIRAHPPADRRKFTGTAYSNAVRVPSAFANLTSSAPDSGSLRLVAASNPATRTPGGWRTTRTRSLATRPCAGSRTRAGRTDRPTAPRTSEAHDRPAEPGIRPATARTTRPFTTRPTDTAAATRCGLPAAEPDCCTGTGIPCGPPTAITTTVIKAASIATAVPTAATRRTAISQHLAQLQSLHRFSNHS